MSSWQSNGAARVCLCGQQWFGKVNGHGRETKAKGSQVGAQFRSDQVRCQARRVTRGCRQIGSRQPSESTMRRDAGGPVCGVLVAACWWDLGRGTKRDRASREEERQRECVCWSLRRCVYGSGSGEGKDEGGAIEAGGVGKIRMTGHKKRKWPIIISRGFSNLEQSTEPALGGQDAFDPVEGREGGGVCVWWCGAVRCGAVLGWTGGLQETRREASSAVVGGVS
jgi:hypothetical protein